MNLLSFSKDNIKRFPRPEIKRFPRKKYKIDNKKIVAATTRTGCVDLMKIKDMVEKDKQERKNTVNKILDTKRKYSEIFKIFRNEYENFFNIRFIPKTKERVISYRNKDGDLIRRKYKTDRARFIEFYIFFANKFSIELQDIKLYFQYAFKLALREYEFTEQTKIFGIAVSEKIADRYFMKEKKKQLQSSNTAELRNRHKSLFKDD